MSVRIQPENRWHMQRLHWKEHHEGELWDVGEQDKRMAEGSDVPGTSHGGRLLRPWKEQEQKMALPDYVRAIPNCNSGRRVTRQKLWPKENQLGVGRGDLFLL